MTRAAALLLAAALIPAGTPPALAQTAPPQPTPPTAVTLPAPDGPGAFETRRELQQVLRQYPPTVGEVLMRDPSLLAQPGYLAPYPALTAFLAQHPEVSRNPGFFFGSFVFRERDPRDRQFEMLGIMLGGLAGIAALVAFLSLLVWLIRSVIDHRRWVRLTRVQTEVHTKLMDRLTANEELLAYIQSPAGRRFLESAPITLEGEARPASAPVARILWSLQAGIVLVALGVGFWMARPNVLEEVSQGFHVLGVVAIALGTGFAVSALAAYLISSRLGLMPPTKSQP